MKKNIFFALIIVSLSFISTFSTAQKLSETSEISILTCAPGDNLYSTFGHSAIRVKDSVRKLDNVYNYGTFNFETPNFYAKFVKGQLDYMLSVAPYKYFVISYMNENRWIKEQVLNLTLNQKNKIYKTLETNALPENMYYRYDFFLDNCATRVKDIIKDALENELVSPEKITQNNETFRELIKPYLTGKNWERFGTNLALGQPADKIVTVDEATFLPDYLAAYFDAAFIKQNNIRQPIVKENRMLFEPKIIKEGTKTFFTPLLVFTILLILFLVISVIEIKQKKYFFIIDKTLFFIVGFVGIAVLALWFATEHTAVVNNWNILWAMPLYFIAAFILKRKNNLLYMRAFFLIMSLLLSIGLIINLSFFKMFDYATVPIIIILIFRSAFIYSKK